MALAYVQLTAAAAERLLVRLRTYVRWLIQSVRLHAVHLPPVAQAIFQANVFTTNAVKITAGAIWLPVLNGAYQRFPVILAIIVWNNNL